MGYAVFHEMDYGKRHLERGEYIEDWEPGINKNDNALLTIGYIKEHNGNNLQTCLRCGKKFVTTLDETLFLRKHEELCPMQEVTVPSDNEQHSSSITEYSIAERAMAMQND